MNTVQNYFQILLARASAGEASGSTPARSMAAGAALIFTLFALQTTGSEPQPAEFQAKSAAISAHMRFLSDDLLEGRDTASRGEAVARAYIAAQFEAFGVAAGGSDGTYLQPVPLVRTQATDQGSFTFSTDGRERALQPFEDYFPLASFTQPSQRIVAPVVFAGFGVVAPERGIDAYAGLDVRGKIVLVLSGAPRHLPSDERSFYSARTLKRQEAAKRGAAALVVLYTPTAQQVMAFDRLATLWRKIEATWADAAGKPFTPAVPEPVMVSLTGGKKILAGARVSFDDIMKAAESKQGKVPSFALPIKATIETHSDISTARSANLIGIVPGSDPQLSKQYVALTAHNDHLGIGPAVNGDTIYNGALDNAAGVAILLETARGFAQASKRPKRSLLFLITTAEEKGEVGADYFVRNPTVDRSAIVADVNVDMPILTYDFTDIIPFGADHSSLGPIVARAAARMGIASSPDPVPEQSVFIRSDHFRFVQQGIPAVMLATGFGGPGRAGYEDYLEHHFHQPSDELSLPLIYSTGAKLTDLVYACTADIANETERPVWNPGDFFGTKFSPAAGAGQR